MQDLLISLERKIGRDSLAKMLEYLSRLSMSDLQQAVLIPEIMYNYRELTARLGNCLGSLPLGDLPEEQCSTGAVDINSKESRQILFDWIERTEQSVHNLNDVSNGMDLIKTLIMFYEDRINDVKNKVNK